ncbi:hypothetical protein [Streptosporangium sp. NPDC051022]|uniref:hypothetical protein n=1 Tax=Streptosporangium sp. NPDC051022 TaxID=3155752 RepID=UPI003416B7A2
MNRTWRTASVELVPGYHLTGADGEPTGSVAAARVAFDGGFAHVEVPGTGHVDVVSAPAVRLITYRSENDDSGDGAGRGKDGPEPFGERPGNRRLR